MGVRIQELPETTGIKKEDLLIVEDGQGTKKGTVQQLDETLGVSQLKEDLSNKITKFYASNQGETHLSDSDNGKIMDMILYGKSLQDGTPSPENPVEIKSVVNPTVKVCGKNLWDNFKKLLSGNVEQKNGTYIATENTMQVDVSPSSSGVRPLLLKANHTYTFSLKSTVSISANKYVCLIYTNGEGENIHFTNNNFINFVPKRDVQKIGFILYKSVAGDKAYDVQLEMGSEVTSYEPYKPVQTVTLPYTLNAIPVSSGGNVTINGQQYIADYVDVERGKLVRIVDSSKLDNTQSIVDKTEWLLTEPQEIDLTTEEITVFKELATYYPTTNISINSEQLDGYTVFNYPISMANGWNYVKQQLNDNRDYIYDMDLQSAEAYVNSEYAVTLTELEV